MKGLGFENVVITLKGRELLSVNANVAPGECLTVMGPSGSGKSSLLAFIGGFLDLVFNVSGKVMLDGDDLAIIPPWQRHAGILFQDPLLFPHMSVGENLLFAIPASVRGKERQERARMALEQSDLAGFFDRDPATLSGGQKARVALMRVLLSQPKTLLLDEPFSKLDSQLRGQIRTMVFEEARRQNLPMVLVTHDAADAEAAGGEVILLE